MRTKLLAGLALGLHLSASAATNTVAFYVTPWADGGTVTRKVLVYPTAVEGSSTIAAYDRRLFTTDTNGWFWVTNMAAGIYNIEIQGPPSTTVVSVYVDPTNSFIYAWSNLVASSSATYPPGKVAWSMAASDQRYLLKGEAGTGTGSLDTNSVNALIQSATFPLASVTNSGNLPLWAMEDPGELDTIVADIATANARIDAQAQATVTNAQHALTADSATTAGTATNAQHAATADSATSANSAAMAVDAQRAAFAATAGTTTNSTGTHTGPVQLTGGTNVAQITNPTTGTIPFWIGPDDRIHGDASAMTGVNASGGITYAISNRVTTTGSATTLATIPMGTNQTKGVRLLVVARTATGQSLVQVVNAVIARGTGDPTVTNLPSGGTDYSAAIADLQAQIDALEVSGIPWDPQFGSQNLTNISAIPTNQFVFSDQLSAATNHAVTSSTNVAKVYTDTQFNALDAIYSAEFANYTTLARHEADTNKVQTAAATYADTVKAAATNKLATDILATAAATYASDARVVGATNKLATDVLATVSAGYATEARVVGSTNKLATDIAASYEARVVGATNKVATDILATAAASYATDARVVGSTNKLATDIAASYEARVVGATNKVATDILATVAATYATDARVVGATNKLATDIAASYEARVVGATNKVATDVLATATATYTPKATFPVCIGVACSDETTALTTGTGKVTFRAPFAFTLSAVRATVTTAPVGATIIVDINEGGTTLMSATKLSIDASELTSTTAASAAVLSDTSIADDAALTIDIDQIGSSTAGAGLKIWLIGTRSL